MIALMTFQNLKIDNFNNIILIYCISKNPNHTNIEKRLKKTTNEVSTRVTSWF